MSAGQAFANGDALHSVTFNWHERLTIVRRDVQSYGVDRYVVRNAAGRHGYAY